MKNFAEAFPEGPMGFEKHEGGAKMFFVFFWIRSPPKWVLISFFSRGPLQNGVCFCFFALKFPCNTSPPKMVP